MGFILRENVMMWVSVREAIVLTEVFKELTVTIFDKGRTTVM
jgi:hypothetical protein